MYLHTHTCILTHNFSTHSFNFMDSTFIKWSAVPCLCNKARAIYFTCVTSNRLVTCVKQNLLNLWWQTKEALITASFQAPTTESTCLMLMVTGQDQPLYSKIMTYRAVFHLYLFTSGKEQNLLDVAVDTMLSILSCMWNFHVDILHTEHLNGVFNLEINLFGNCLS